jgi:hypothetical protein
VSQKGLTDVFNCFNDDVEAEFFHVVSVEELDKIVGAIY